MQAYRQIIHCHVDKVVQEPHLSGAFTTITNYRFNCANLLVSSSTSGILPPGPLSFFSPLSGPGMLTLGRTLSVLGEGGMTDTGLLGVISRGGVARVSSSFDRGSSVALTFWPPDGLSSLSSSSSSWSLAASWASRFALMPGGQSMPYASAIVDRYASTSSFEGGSTFSLLVTRSDTLPSVFSMACKVKSLPYFSARSCLTTMILFTASSSPASHSFCSSSPALAVSSSQYSSSISSSSVFISERMIFSTLILALSSLPCSRSCAMLRRCCFANALQLYLDLVDQGGSGRHDCGGWCPRLVRVVPMLCFYASVLEYITKVVDIHGRSSWVAKARPACPPCPAGGAQVDISMRPDYDLRTCGYLLSRKDAGLKLTSMKLLNRPAKRVLNPRSDKIRRIDRLPEIRLLCIGHNAILLRDFLKLVMGCLAAGLIAMISSIASPSSSSGTGGGGGICVCRLSRCRSFTDFGRNFIELGCGAVLFMLSCCCPPCSAANVASCCDAGFCACCSPVNPLLFGAIFPPPRD
ncbi:hypothetical protein KC345_g322 [Hortaea werneckii]|nr:hypothetical protein KC345_g322 [Hortaea werneckii]